jgi:hypothetical protein
MFSCLAVIETGRFARKDCQVGRRSRQRSREHKNSGFEPELGASYRELLRESALAA